MKYQMNFGMMPPAGSPATSGCFRIAILGDFSGRANQGKLETGDALASRKPLRVDVDNLDELIERLDVQLHLPISDDGGSVKVPITEMESFHPDELYENLELFSKLSGLRDKLEDTSTFPAASKAIQKLLGTAAVDKQAHRRKASRGSAIPNAKMSDFASLVGRESATAETPVNSLVKGLMRSHIVPEADPAQDQMVAVIDEALSDAMRRVLHDPDFQALESVWRSIELLVRRLETDSSLQIVLYDITAEEIAADLSATDQLEETGLYKLFVEQPKLDAQQGALSVLIGNYTFDQTPPHADLLGRIAKISAAACAPFVAAVSNDCLKRANPEDIPPVVTESWDQLRALPEAGYLALTTPRFMLRWPYGSKTEPIDSFEFEEFTRKSGVGGMLWGNSAFLAGLLLGQTYRNDGLSSMKLGSILGVDDLPFYYYTDEHGDQIALPCADRLLSERLAAYVMSQRFLPVLAIKGQPEVRLGGFGSLSGQPLAGPWAPLNVEGGAATPAAAPSSAGASEAASTGDDELDDLLADLDALDGDDPPAEEASPGEEASSDDSDDDDDLDALLAELGGDDDEASDGDMDDDLAALLDDL
ncbi:MAG: type VI secretion system contractile sheath large subunit [Planctomycetota bacterium]